MNILEKAKLALLVQKAVNELDEKEICEFIDQLAIFVQANAEKNIDGNIVITKHIAESEAVRNMIIHVTEVYSKHFADLIKDPVVEANILKYRPILVSAKERLAAVS